MTDLSGFDEAASWFDRAPCGLLATDADGMITAVNQTFADLSGFTRESLIGRRRFADLLSPGGRIYHETHYAPTLRMQGSADEIALDIVRVDGQRLPVLVNSVVDRDNEASDIVRIRIALIAASQRRLYERELLAAKQRAENSESNARLLAHTLQQTLLPPEIPFIPGLDIGTVYRAAGDGLEVGGDFYDVFQIRADDWMIVIGDVQGKGAKAAIVTAIARHTIRAAAVEHHQPSEILHHLNEVLLRYSSDRFCTAAIIRCRRSNAQWHLTTSCAGHPPPLLARPDAAPIEIARPGVLSGAFPDAVYHDTDIILQAEDVVVAFTDGLIEARRGDEFFGEERTGHFLQHHAQQSAQIVATSLMSEVLQFQSDPGDDIAIITARPTAERTSSAPSSASTRPLEPDRFG
ncbi:MAG: SpoIIE family protein phosphatase [Ilumatobacteraceae bacterium]